MESDGIDWLVANLWKVFIVRCYDMKPLIQIYYYCTCDFDQTAEILQMFMCK